MRYFLLYYLPLLLSVSECHALFLDRTSLPPIPRGDGRRVSSRYDSNITFTNANGTLESVPYRYITNITVNGENFRVILDTGSSDLIIKPRGDFVFNDTGIQVTNHYGGGYIAGTIGFASVQMGNYTFDAQGTCSYSWRTEPATHAFLETFTNTTSFVSSVPLIPASQSSVTEIFDIGLDGLIGVSFDGAQAPDMMAALNDSGWDPTFAEPFLYNIFDQTPEENNFIGVSLSRSGDLEGSADASFTINEIDETYAAAVNAPLLPIFPGTNGRWTILVDDISIDGTNISLPTSTAPMRPRGNYQLVDSIYSAIPGARYRPSDHACSGQPFPIHPLDLSDLSVDAYSNSDPPTCVATIEASGGNGEDDGVFGDPFMRNMYSVFNFGDAISKSPTGNASIQLLSQTDPIAAAADVLNVRMPRISPSPTASATDDPVSTSTLSNSPANSASGTTLAAALENDSTSPTNSDSEVKKWAPIVIGLLGGNLLVMLILAAIGLALCIKRGGKNSAPKPKYHPVRFGEDEARPLDGFEDKRYSD
ncbi:aspartic peptidase domain-containing protein [Mycena latifolia]|nr:aspartic peptidase domain-containing protein [Mycena latifolia]